MNLSRVPSIARRKRQRPPAWLVLLLLPVLIPIAVLMTFVGLTLKGIVWGLRHCVAFIFPKRGR